jgi:hypothetical protein
VSEGAAAISKRPLVTMEAQASKVATWKSVKSDLPPLPRAPSPTVTRLALGDV